MAILIPHWELAEQIGSHIEIEAATVDELISIGSERWGEPFRKACKRAAIVVNGRSISRLTGGRTPLSSSDTVWFILPAAGG